MIVQPSRNCGAEFVASDGGWIRVGVAGAAQRGLYKGWHGINGGSDGQVDGAAWILSRTLARGDEAVPRKVWEIACKESHGLLAGVLRW
jgi:hypothetical protein